MYPMTNSETLFIPSSYLFFSSAALPASLSELEVASISSGGGRESVPLIEGREKVLDTLHRIS